MGNSYIDFDNVLVDTTPLLLGEWKKTEELNGLDEGKKIDYIASCDWNYILYNSAIINDGIYYLKEMPIKTTKILTKVHSLVNEGGSKIMFLRSLGVKNEVILVPYNLRKIDVVSPKGNRLIDDAVRNLDPWDLYGGKSIFFNKNDENIDEWGDINTKYQKIKCLGQLKR